MKTMISNLPRDLIEDIISRVPLKSMKAVRLTCKSWNNLSKSESLRKATRTTREGETMMIAISNYKLYLMSVVVGVNPSMELKGQLSSAYDEISITRVLHFEGLLLLILRDFGRVVVWNPYWGQTVWIKLRDSHGGDGHGIFSYAIGYEDKKSCRSVKLLRFIDYFYEAPEKQFFCFEIYDFDSGLWKTLDVTPQWGINCSSKGVTLKGNTYWCAKNRSFLGYTRHIICFDFTRERFGPLLPLPVDVMDHDYGYVSLSCVKEEKIAALFQHFVEDELEIWITTKINVEMVSWSKFLRMDSGPKIEVPHTFFIDEEKKVFMDLNFDSDDESGYIKHYTNVIGDAGYLKRMDIGVLADQNDKPHDCSYVPSLIQIRKPSRGKRIKESRLKKRRFIQNMPNMPKLAAIQNLIRIDRYYRRRMRKSRN